MSYDERDFLETLLKAGAKARAQGRTFRTQVFAVHDDDCPIHTHYGVGAYCTCLRRPGGGPVFLFKLVDEAP